MTYASGGAGLDGRGAEGFTTRHSPNGGNGRVVADHPGVRVPFYTFAYNWAFDRIFGVPDSAVNDDRESERAEVQASA